MASEELKQEAAELGIVFSPNIGDAKLQAKIDEYYESQETSGKELEDLVLVNEQKEKEQSEEKSVETGKGNKLQSKIAKAKADAYKTQVVTIIDNDQRVNNQTTTAVVNCSNEYFDLGTIVLPLNTPVEVRQGHINVLKELRIPQHVRDSKTNLSTVRLVPRYTVATGV